MVRLEHVYGLMNPKDKNIKFATVDDALDIMEVSAVYNLFDLEATRRERDRKNK